MGKSIQLKDKNKDKVYPNPYFPVGSIYLSVVNTNPNKWFGGTWEKIAQGRTLVGVDINDTDFNTVKKMGGSKYLQQHEHVVKYQNFGFIDNQALESGYGTSKRATVFDVANTTDTGSVRAETINVTTGNSGNLQPYFTCYIWCRTA